MIHHFQEDEIAALLHEERGEFTERLRHLRFARRPGEVRLRRAADHREHVGQRTGDRDACLAARRSRPERRADGRPVYVLEAVGITGRAEDQP